MVTETVRNYEAMSEVGASIIFADAMKRIAKGERYNLGLTTGNTMKSKILAAAMAALSLAGLEAEPFKDGDTVVFYGDSIDGLVSDIGADIPVVCDLNQKILQVRSLPRGRWALEIDGTRVGAWFSPEWERGINLAKPVAHHYRIVRVPAYAYRGFMLDEARYFFGKAKVKELLDVMAEHKMNYFHWHLTDDQGWRVDLPGLPELVKAGARRDASPKRGQDRELDGVPYGPYFYTADDVREIVAYAKDRGIEVIPEIDLPGHVRTILAAHPEFCCKPREELRKSHNTWGIAKDVLCLGNPEAIAYVERILDATCALFPCAYVHIGGDECPGDNWWGCAKCRAKIDREGLVDCPRLQAAFTRHVAAYLAKKGRRAIGWDEVLTAKTLPKGMTVQVWHGNKVRAAAESGADVIVSTLEEAYLSIPTGEPGDGNWPYRKWVVEKRMTLPVSRIERFDLEKGLPEALKGRIAGGECCAWTEEMASAEELDFKVKARLAAFGDLLYLGPVIPRSKE